MSSEYMCRDLGSFSYCRLDKTSKIDCISFARSQLFDCNFFNFDLAWCDMSRLSSIGLEWLLRCALRLISHQRLQQTIVVIISRPTQMAYLRLCVLALMLSIAAASAVPITVPPQFDFYEFFVGCVEVSSC